MSRSRERAVNGHTLRWGYWGMHRQLYSFLLSVRGRTTYERTQIYYVEPEIESDE